MTAGEIKTPSLYRLAPADTIATAAVLMREHDIGAVPVVDDRGGLAGFLTDRDIVIRTVAKGFDSESTLVEDAMSPSVIVVFENQSVEECANLMEEYQIRRLPVLDFEKRLVGMISLGDVAVRADTALSGLALKEISQPNPAYAEKPESGL